ncbi:hypothetical protein ACFVIM_30070 [Streptomyces sp. NPDC057638]|uniref:hypothetical protein n=1 Tax=Streptomyces sp. NPDC057638 TaxID=3346190 RepID=UPI003680C70C
MGSLGSLGHEGGRGDDVPIYERLTQEWAGAGRTLPGVPDGEWSRLTQFPPPLLANPSFVPHRPPPP